MTGKDLILYIMLHDLEDEPVIQDGKLLGFMTEAEAAEKFGVGVATIRVWVNEDVLKGYRVNDALLIPCSAMPKEITNK